jgi:hypothetical protein
VKRKQPNRNIHSKAQGIKESIEKTREGQRTWLTGRGARQTKDKTTGPQILQTPASSERK